VKDEAAPGARAGVRAAAGHSYCSHAHLPIYMPERTTVTQSVGRASLNSVSLTLSFTFGET
jgi:hypothetical protein